MIATLVGAVLELRPKGLRRSETVHLASCYETAVKQRVLRDALERLATRRGRR